MTKVQVRLSSHRRSRGIGFATVPIAANMCTNLAQLGCQCAPDASVPGMLEFRFRTMHPYGN